MLVSLAKIDRLRAEQRSVENNMLLKGFKLNEIKNKRF